MIGIVNVNPCIDKTVFVKSLTKDTVAIADRTDIHSGGKGVNVARVLKSLGTDSVIFSVLAGETGSQIKRLMEEEGLSAHCVSVGGLSRTYTTVVDNVNSQFAIKEKGPQISKAEVVKIKEEFLNFLDQIDFLCISDTIACENMIDFSAWAVKKAKENKIKVFLDTDNTALRLALNEMPDIVKPNNDELAALIGVKENKTDYLKYLFDVGIEFPIVSLGKEGCLSKIDDKKVRVIPPKVKTVCSVGCGDSFIGGLLHGIRCGMKKEECLAFATATGAANALDWRAAYVDKETIENLLPMVKIEVLE